jgi:lysozyme
MPAINVAGVALVKSFEGCELQAYKDATGIPTIGYGHTGTDVRLGQTITQAQADAYLAADLTSAASSVANMVRVQLTPNQFAALVSFAYNVGAGALMGSTLLRCVNAGNFTAAAAQFGVWIHAGAQTLPGLVRRRAAEAALFRKP